MSRSALLPTPAWASIPISTANAPGAPCQEGQCQQQHRLCKKGASRATVESQRSPFSHPPACLRAPRPATTTTQKESLQPPPRSHVLPEFVEDEAGLVRQLAGRHAAGTGATLSWGRLRARGADPPASPTPGPAGAAATSGHSRSRRLLQGSLHPNQLLQLSPALPTRGARLPHGQLSRQASPSAPEKKYHPLCHTSKQGASFCLA